MNRLPKVTLLSTDQTDYLRLIKPDQSVRLHAGYITLQPGESVGEHSTEEREEIIIVLQGEGSAWADSLPGPMPFRAPAIVCMPPNARTPPAAGRIRTKSG